MRPYSVEIYSRELMLKDHNTIDYDSYEYKYDYLDPEQNKIKVLKPLNAALYDYIRIFGNGRDIYGYIMKLSNGDDDSKDYIEITFIDLMNIFDIDIIVDTADFGQGYLENYLADMIAETYIDNQDSLQNIYGLEVVAKSETTDWTLDITADEENTKTKANLLDDIIIAAFRRYSVKIDIGYSMKDKKITAAIYVNNNDIVPIEVKLPNILSKSIKYRQVKKEVNKVVVANKKDYTVRRIYYLHTDGTHSVTDTDRITPVYSKLDTVSTKTTDEWIEKFASTLNSSANTIASDQSKLDKGEELKESELEKEITAVAEINKIPGVIIAIDDTGRVISFDLSSIEMTQTENEQGGLSAYISDTFDDSTASYSSEPNAEGGISVYFQDIYTESVPYSKEKLQEIIDTFITTVMYVRLCERFALEEFTKKADEKANKTFGSNKYENLIKIECGNNDTRLTPWDMEIGQRVIVYDDGNAYETILTGKQIKGTSTLIFGNERIELTKMLKGRS